MSRVGSTFGAHLNTVRLVVQHALEKLGIVVGNTWVLAVFSPVSTPKADHSREANNQCFQERPQCSSYARTISTHNVSALSIRCHSTRLTVQSDASNDELAL